MSGFYPTKLLLAFRGGDMCAVCNAQLTPDSGHGGAVNVGEAAAGSELDFSFYSLSGFR